jgi:mono/diheme cytochrome c family protein
VPATKWSEGKAAVVAATVSMTMLMGTLSLAAVMRRTSFVNGPATFRNSALAGPVSGAVAADAVEGRHLFLMNCAHCHGDDATGDEGPDLHNLHKSDARIHQVITAGIKGEMPSFAKKFDEKDVRALTAYLRTLNDGKPVAKVDQRS